MDIDDDLIPTKDPGSQLTIDLSRPDHLLLHERNMVTKFTRTDLEDR
jgi:hypothetical protein